ncbi:lytic transglycosylase domain-containing protein [Cupriavidus campinensis]|uniref:Lytic transglycosylase domain-containing protein n=1 Tax=Cupriavidus campinensis TaxID=151783 RepID=A0ABY3EJJ2_9BURK|nr:lytic transglycosylase domain-containing protein [Cupriavidus campinensis]TSP10976.1 lytic transglycosylase domain-containing protein [Cupriavidus campinensis]
MRRLILATCLSFFAASVHAQADLNALLAACAPTVHPTTMGAIVKTESNGRMFVLSDDGPRSLPFSERKAMLRTIHAGTAAEAATIAKDLISKGHLVGLGLTQVSSQNLARLGLTVEQVLDPCTNLQAGSKILAAFYVNAAGKYRDEQAALRAAISAYNTGNFERGFSNGYVRTVLNNTTAGVPALVAGPVRSTPAPPAGRSAMAARPFDPRHAELEVEFQ